MTTTLKAIGIGAGGHARVVLDILRLVGAVEVVGLLDPRRIGEQVAGVPVIGDESKLADLRAQGVAHGFVGVGGNTDTAVRQRLFDLLIAHDFSVVSAIHPAAVIAASATLGDGVTVMAGAIVNPAAAVGHNVTLNTACVVEHDCAIAHHAFIGPGAVLAGGVHVGQATFIGAGAVVLPGVHVGDRAIVAAGAVVTQQVAAGSLVVGVPARSRASS